MSWLVAFVGSGTAIDWILGLVAGEAALLSAYRRYTGSGLKVATIFSLLLPGTFLLLALRCALTNAGAIAIAAFLLAAFVAHICDLARRWRSQPPRRLSA